MVRQASLQTDLGPIVGPENMRPAAAYLVDGVMPRVAVAAATPDAVREVIRYANTHHLAIIPQGGRRHIGLGNLPGRYDIALDTTLLDAISEYEPEDLTITCGAGITLGALRQTTAEAGQTVPIDPDIPDEATVGGVLAAGAWGPSRMSLGAPRDFTLGLRLVTGDGIITRAGGRVVKNVAGYDMCKLYTGSLGTLAVITEATFKTVPLPAANERLTLAFKTAGDACRLANDALMRGLAVRSAVVSRESGRWLLDLRLAGSPAAVSDSLSTVRSQAGRANDASHPPADPPPAAVTCLVSSSPSGLPALLESLPANVTLAAYPTLGAARLSGDSIPDIVAPFFIESCPPELKRNRDVFGGPPGALALMRALKSQLDPNGVLNPARFVGGI